MTVEEQFLNKAKFSKMVEKAVGDLKITYMDAILYICEKNDIDLICRGHLVVDAGYEFFADRKLITIFSAPNYCGMFENDGCLMKVAEDLTCSFSILKPQRIPEYKLCFLSAEEAGPPHQHKLLKNYMKPRPVKKELEKGNSSIYAEEH